MPMLAILRRGDLLSSIWRGTGEPSSSPPLFDAHARPLGRERLVGEAHVHHRGGVALGGREVDEPALGQQVDALAAGEDVLLDERRGASRGSTLAGASWRGMSISTSKWPGVADDRAVLHRLEVLALRSTCMLPVTVTKMSPFAAASAIGMHAEAVHQRLRAPRIGSISVTITCAPMPARAHRDAAPAPAVAGDDERSCRRAACWSRG